MKFLRKHSKPTGSCSAHIDLEIFHALSAKEQAAADRFLNIVEVPAGKALVVEGAMVRDFAVIVTGQVGVTIGGEAVGVLDRGSQFGSVGLLEAQDALATFSALAPCKLAVCGRREFASLRLAAPQLAARIDAITQRRLQYLADRDASVTQTSIPAATTPQHHEARGIVV